MNRIRELLDSAEYSFYREALAESHWAINTTTRCQQRCFYCFEGRRDNKRDLPVAEVRDFLQRAASRVPKVVFMGAEPTMNPDLVDLIAYGRQLGLRVDVSTNALRFRNARYLEDCLQAGLSGCELSFPYPDADVYSQLAGIGPKGYTLLLEALANIDAANAARSGTAADLLRLNVNVVVSRFNFDRLDDVLDTLERKLVTTPFGVTFKWVSPASLGAARYVRDCHVPLGALRTRFADLVASWRRPFPAVFRDFPLCALPGFEELAANPIYLQSGTEVECNFEDQQRFRAMHPNAVQRNRFLQHCTRCALDPICLDRGILTVDVENPDNLPVRSARPAAEVLVGLGLSPGSAAAVVAAHRAPSPPPQVEVGDDWVAARLLAAFQECRSPAWASLDQARIVAARGRELLVALPGGEATVSCRAAPAATVAGPAFLCGPLALVPHPILQETDAGVVLLGLLARALAHAAAKLPPPVPDVDATVFTILVWTLLGDWLLPRVGAQGTLHDSVVAEGGLELRSRTPRAGPVALSLRRRDDHGGAVPPVQVEAAPQSAGSEAARALARAYQARIAHSWSKRSERPA